MLASRSGPVAAFAAGVVAGIALLAHGDARQPQADASCGIGSAAHDWRRFDDRMNWAICLFRSRQQDRTLYWPPYSVEDTRRIVAGEMPRASGHPGQAAVMPPLDPASFISAALEGLPRAGEG